MVDISYSNSLYIYIAQQKFLIPPNPNPHQIIGLGGHSQHIGNSGACPHQRFDWLALPPPF